MGNVIQFKSEAQLRHERIVAFADEWRDRQAIEAQLQTVKCFVECITKMDPKHSWTARVMVKEEQRILDKMVLEYESKYGKL